MNCTVYLEYPHGTRRLPLYALYCPLKNAGCRLDYDGTDAGIFLANVDTAVALGLLYKCLDAFMDEGRGLQAYVGSVAKAYADYGPIGAPPFLSDSAFRRAFYTFLEQLEVDFCFQCPKCLDAPPVLVGDGTSMTMSHRHYSGTSITAVDTNLPEVPQEHNRVKRAFLDDRLAAAAERHACADQLRAFAKHIKPVPAGGAAAAPPAPFDTGPLLDQGGVYSLAGFISWVEAHLATFTLADRYAVSGLLKCLASDSPVITYFPACLVPEYTVALQAAPGSRIISSALLRTTETEAPVLGAVLRLARARAGGGSGGGDLNVTTAFLGLLDELSIRSGLCARGPDARPAATSPPPPSAASTACLHTGICTGLPQLRARPSYQADKKNESTPCRHESFARGRRTGGIFTWFCEHGVCYGFHVIEKAEGRNEPFSFLTCYLKEAPKVVVYDFACALEEYCRNREPAFFKFTRFIVDEFHWPGHPSCAPNYDIRLYPWLATVNSVVAEQNNSALARVKPSVTRMSQRPFMTLLRLFTNNWNQKKIAKLTSTLAYLAGLQQAPP